MQMTFPEQQKQLEILKQSAWEFSANWIARRQGSPSDFVEALEDHLGWPVRHIVIDILNQLRTDRDLEDTHRKYLNYTLGPDAVSAVLYENAKPGTEHQSSLDELFARSRQFRSSKQFAEAVEFVSRFREYSPFNNMLVYLQNPLTTFFATSKHWAKSFGRTIKEDARPMIILAPRTPVLLVYDIADTTGPKLPDKLELFSKTSGRFHPLVLNHTIKNCAREKILIERKSMSPLRGGCATARLHDPDYRIRILIRAELDDASAYAVLCHELAHVFLGHLGTTRDGWWPYRLKLSTPEAEIEAEAVAHTVCRRAGLTTQSAEYLSTYFCEDNDLSSLSLDLVCRVAGRIEEMGKKLLPPRKTKSAEPDI